MSLRIRELNELSRRKIQHLASFPELNPSPILETDKNGKITFVNKATYSFLEKFDNRNKIDLFLPKDFSEIIKSLHYLKRDKTYFREIKINDHIFAEEINLLYKLQVTRIYARDITKRREIKDALERSEKRYYSLFNEMRAANALYQIICNKQGKPIDCIILDVNPAHEKLIGIKKYNIIGKLYTELFPHEKVDWELFGKVALGGKSVHFVKYSHVWKRYFDMLIFSPTKGQFAVMRIDITKRKKIELENEELYQKLHTEQQRKDEFIAIMGHELRNPLAAISTSIQLQQEYMQSKENDQMLDKSELEIFKEVAEISSNQVNNMSRLLDDMLDVSRIAQGKILLKKKIFDIKIAINEAINNISQKNELNNRTLTVVIPKINILVKGDQVRIQQIIINLLSNAVRYTKNKGKIWLKVKIKNGFVNVSVKDDGLGIPTDKLSLIFEPFYRLKNAKKKSIDGMGVGLMIVKKLVELHHGEIKAKSKGLQKGSEFILSLPIIKHYKKEQKMDKTSEKNETETRSRKKILVVDDNEKIVNMIVKLLSLKGYDVRFANNGSTAINIAKEFRPEVVVLDIGLPGKDGYQIARLLRKDVSERKEKLQIIGVSGYGQEQDIKKSIEAGFDEYLVKPIEISQLIDVINKNSEDNK